MGASAFVDSNYFRGGPNPMMSSKQGTDALGDGTFSGEDGGIIKAYNNTFAESPSSFSYITYAQNSTSFDAYEVSSAKTTVPSSVKTLSGGTVYNNFDTSSVMYSYTADAPAQVPAIVTANAGRMQGGDFRWTFNNSVDDASYAVNTALKSALVAYQTSIVSIGSGAYVTPTDPPVTTTTTTATGSGSTSTTTTTSGGDVTPSDYVHNFTLNGLSSNFYSISGNLSDSKGTMTYNGLTLTQCLKMESATSITFTLTSAATLTLVIKDGTTFKVDDTAYDIPAEGVFTLVIGAGSHSIAKGSGSSNLYYMAVALDGSLTTTTTTTATTVTTTTTTTATTTTVTEPDPAAGVWGDADCNGILALSDAILLAKANAGATELSTQGKINCNVYADSKTDSADLGIVLQLLLNKVTQADMPVNP